MNRSVAHRSYPGLLWLKQDRHTRVDDFSAGNLEDDTHTLAAAHAVSRVDPLTFESLTLSEFNGTPIGTVKFKKEKRKAA